MRLGTALWLIVVLVATALRLGGLDLQPLNDDEAHRALAAHRMAQGESLGGIGDPLAVVSAALVFFLVGESDAAARLPAALWGVALVALPWFWRRELGEGAMLLAAALAASSPTLVNASRLVSGDQAMAVLGLLLVRAAGGVEKGPGGRALLGVLAGLLLLAGSSGWAAMLLLGTAGLLALRGRPDRLRRVLRGCLDHPVCWLSALATYGILGGLLTGTLTPWTDAVRTWVALWEWPERGDTPLGALALALAYEPLTVGLLLVAGPLAAWRSARPPEGWRRLFGAWALAGALLWLATAGTDRGLFALALFPGLLFAAPRVVDWVEAAALSLRQFLTASLPPLAGVGALLVLVVVQTHALFALNFAVDSPELWPASRTDAGARRTMEELARDLRRPPQGAARVADEAGPAAAWYLRLAHAAPLPVAAQVGGSVPSGAVAYAKIGLRQRQAWQGECFDLALAWRWLVRRASPGPRQGLDLPIYLLATSSA